MRRRFLILLSVDMDENGDGYFAANEMTDDIESQVNSLMSSYIRDEDEMGSCTTILLKEVGGKEAARLLELAREEEIDNIDDDYDQEEEYEDEDDD